MSDKLTPIEPYKCSLLGREDWIPPEDRNMEKILENSGIDSAHSFVYLPKIVLPTELGDLYCLQVPIGALFYWGAKFKKCDQINDPSNPSCILCEDPHWFTDYYTASAYGQYKDFVYAYEVTQPLHLLNTCDIRNLTVLLNMYKHQLGIDEILTRHPDYVTNSKIYLVYDTNNNEYLSLKSKRDEIDFIKFRNFVNFIKTLDKVVSYPFTEEFKNQYIPEHYRDTNNVARNRKKEKIQVRAKRAPAPAEYEAEFGNQDALLRNSVQVHDESFMLTVQQILRDYMPKRNGNSTPNSKPFMVHGYYSPIYPSSRQKITSICGTKKVPVFHREIALFFTKNFVRRVPQNSRNGCVLQAAYSAPGAAATKRTRKRRSNRRKSRRNSK